HVRLHPILVDEPLVVPAAHPPQIPVCQPDSNGLTPKREIGPNLDLEPPAGESDQSLQLTQVGALARDPIRNAATVREEEGRLQRRLEAPPAFEEIEEAFDEPRAYERVLVDAADERSGSASRRGIQSQDFGKRAVALSGLNESGRHRNERRKF